MEQVTTAEAAKRLRELKTIDKTTRLCVERAIAACEEIDAAWFMIEHGWDIESRAELEKASATNGFKYGLAQAVHHMHKRHRIETPDWVVGSVSDSSQAEREK